MNTLPSQELEQRFHAVMAHPLQWRAVKYEIDIAYETGLPEALVITFQSAPGGFKRLRFLEPRWREFGPLQIPSAQALYVADLADLGWSSGQGIEVGQWEEERAVLFWARAVGEL